MYCIENTESYKYLQRICANLEPRDEDELIFKMRLKWILDTAAEQSSAIANIDRVYNSDLSIPPPSRKLRLIKGGK